MYYNNGYFYHCIQLNFQTITEKMDTNTNEKQKQKVNYLKIISVILKIDLAKTMNGSINSLGKSIVLNKLKGLFYLYLITNRKIMN